MGKKPKMVLIARKDLNMSPGKLAAQCCHGAVWLMIGDRGPEYQNWMNTGMKKVVLQVNSEIELDTIAMKAAKLKLNWHLVQDAGLTELPPGTSTIVAIGPATEQQLKKVTGSLKLYE